MIRKWLKFNASFIEILKNSTFSKNQEQGKYILTGNPCRFNGNHRAPINNVENGFVSPLASFSINPINPSKKFQMPDPREKGDGRDWSELSDESECGIVVDEKENVAKTKIFEIRGPKGSAFLVEIDARDAEEVKEKLTRLNGDIFHFEKGIAEKFAIECLLAAEPLAESKDRIRLAKIHAISSGSELLTSHLDENGRFYFVNSIEKATRAKRMLEKFHYKISGMIYRIQPKRKARVKDQLLVVCREFVESVEKLPKVLSVTHNL